MALNCEKTLPLILVLAYNILRCAHCVRSFAFANVLFTVFVIVATAVIVFDGKHKVSDLTWTETVEYSILAVIAVRFLIMARAIRSRGRKHVPAGLSRALGLFVVVLLLCSLLLVVRTVIMIVFLYDGQSIHDSLVTDLLALWIPVSHTLHRSCDPHDEFHWLTCYTPFSCAHTWHCVRCAAGVHERVFTSICVCDIVQDIVPAVGYTFLMWSVDAPTAASSSDELLEKLLVDGDFGRCAPRLHLWWCYYFAR